MNTPRIAACVLFLFSLAGCARSVDPNTEARIAATEKSAAKVEAANAALVESVDRLASRSTAALKLADDVARLQSELEMTRDLLVKATARIRSLEDTIATSARDQTKQADLLELRIHRAELECERLRADLTEQKRTTVSRR